MRDTFELDDQPAVAALRGVSETELVRIDGGIIPVVVGVGLCVAGFAAGFAAGYVLTDYLLG